MKQIEFFNNVYFFEDEDYINFDKFLSSPFFNNLQSPIIVFRIIKSNHKLIKNRRYMDMKIAIFKKSKYNDIHLRKILSKLNELYIEYIKVVACKDNQYFKEYLSSKYLLSIGNFDLLNKRVKVLENLTTENGKIDEDVFLKNYEIDLLKYDIISSVANNLNPLEKAPIKKYYTLESSKNLLVYTIAKETINFLNYVLQCNGIVDKAFSIDLEKLYKILKSSELKTFSNHKITTIKLFYRIFLLFKTPTNDKHYSNYIEFYNNVKGLYNDVFCKAQTEIMMGFCNLRQRIKDENRFYFKEGLKIQYQYFENNYYLDQNTKYLNSVIYRNYIINCTNSGEIDLLELLKENKKIILNPEDESNMRRFCEAHLSYLKGKYLLSVTLIKSLINPKVYLKFDVFILLIKSYYELKDLESIEGTLHNYLYYIKNGRFFTKFEKNRYLLLHNYMRSFITTIYNFETDQNIYGFELLLKDILSLDTFVMKNWLIEKLKKIITEHNIKHKKKSRHR